jgi:NAD+ diphosphatase
MVNSNNIPLGAEPIERAAHRRGDTAWLDSAIRQKDALVFLMQDGLPCLEGRASGRVPRPGETVTSAPRHLFWMGDAALQLSPAHSVLFLGEDKAGAPVFALDLPRAFDIDTSLIAGAAGFEDMRAAAAWLSPLEANLAATARSLFLWHAAHGFCARCGAPSISVDAGWKRQCPACTTEHFPRTDPVAIMLATRGEYALLGRQKMWPQGFWSALAGFCEPGETIEQAAARELFEEAGIKCDPARARYIACQPWPFPSSLMIGLILEADSDEIRIDPSEIEAARWVSRAEVRKIMQGTHDQILCPPKLAIAHHLLAKWALEGD